MDRSNIEKDRPHDGGENASLNCGTKIQTGVRRTFPASTGFLSPASSTAQKFLFGDLPGLFAFGGYADAERKMLIFCRNIWTKPTYAVKIPGSLSPCGILSKGTPHPPGFSRCAHGQRRCTGSRGDICVGSGCCDFFVTEQIAPTCCISPAQADQGPSFQEFALQNVTIAPAQTKKFPGHPGLPAAGQRHFHSGFRIGRSLASGLLTAGKASIDGLPLQNRTSRWRKGRRFPSGDWGKFFSQVNGQTKKAGSA